MHIYVTYTAITCDIISIHAPYLFHILPEEAEITPPSQEVIIIVDKNTL